MAPAQDATNYVYQGVWTNWTHGRFWGSTLTLNPQYATILSSALAIFISAAGSQLWHLIQFALYKYRSTTSEQDFLFHQSQSVLRNSETELSTLWNLIRLGIAWKDSKHAHVLRRLGGLILWAFAALILVTAAGLLSSYGLDAGSDVLSISPWCGDYRSDYIDTVYGVTYQNDSDNELALSDEFAGYVNSRFVYVKQLVDFDVAENRSMMAINLRPTLSAARNFVPGGCPVDNTICHPEAGGSMSFDTGFLSSHHAFGYNSGSADQVSVRITTECAPLQAEDYVTGWQSVYDNDSQITRKLCDASYGVGRDNARNATMTLTKQDLTCDELYSRPPWVVMPFNAFPGPDGRLISPMFEPIQELYTAYSDLNLVMWSFQGTYGEPVMDPWFSADQLIEIESPCTFKNSSTYTRQYPLTAMACTQKWQFCNSGSPHADDVNQCTDLAGIYQVESNLLSNSPNITLTPRQMAITERLLRIAESSSVYYVVLALTQAGSPPLNLLNTVHHTDSPVMPPDQWHVETSYWMQLVIAYLQQANLDYSTGQFAASTDYINVTQPSSGRTPEPSQDAAYWLCQNQIIQSKVYRNFNFFLLCLTAVSCLLIIVFGLTIGDISIYLRRRRVHNSHMNHKPDIWGANSHLDMLLHVHKLISGKPWGISRNGVPVTHISHRISAQDLLIDYEQYCCESVEEIAMTSMDIAKRRSSSPSSVSGIQHATTKSPYERSEGVSQVTSRLGEIEPDDLGFTNGVESSREQLVPPKRDLLAP